MRQKRNRKMIVIIIFLLLILILLTGIAYAYFLTDTFKSNKELFFKYVTQIGDKENGFIEKDLKEYFEKQKDTLYINEGNASVNITTLNNQEQFNPINNIKIVFDGQVDKANSKNVQNISLNYSDQVKAPFSYKQIGNIVGIKTDYIGSKYVAIDKEKYQNLKDSLELGEDFTTNINSFQKLQEFANVQFNAEELKHIKNTYFNILNGQLQDSNFSKIEEGTSKGYKLALTGQDLENLIIRLLQNLKNDKTTLDKINEYLKIYKNSSKITASNIDNLIKDINNNSEVKNKNIEIVVYQEKQKTSKLIIKMNHEISIQIDKSIVDNLQQYHISIEMNQESKGTIKISLSADYSGIQSLQNIDEKYELNVQSKESSQASSLAYQYNFMNRINFTDNVNIEAFSDANSMILNDYDQEQVTNFMKAVDQRLKEVNKKQMEQLGLEENENPLQYLIPQFGMYFSELNQIDTNSINEEQVTIFNSKFENYESTNLQGVTVKGLLSTIQLNNETQENENLKIKEIHFDGNEYEVTDQNITLIKSSIEIENYYRVAFERDEDTGIIYRTVINKK